MKSRKLMTTDEPQLVVRDLCKEYRTSVETLAILHNVQLEMKPGEDLSIVGPSGCGKSTLLYILGTLDQPTSGSVQLDGVNPFALSNRELAAFRNQSIGFVFQDHHLLPQLTVLENVLLPALALGTPSPATVQRADYLIEAVGLTDRRHHVPAELSGGERQRTAVARALLGKPRLLLADEPTGNLDINSSQRIAELLFDLPKREGAMLIVVTHSTQVAQRASRRMRIDSRQLIDS
jgi:lipoprotein-releasing system ATP-binding protein